MARTAAIVGTANAVTHKQSQKYAQQDQQAAQAAAYQQQAQYAPPPPQQAAPAPAPAVDPTVEKINQLAALHAQGILSDEEFASAKAKALGL
jgi:hypothetical protein